MTAPVNGLHADISREAYDEIDREHYSRLKLLGKSAAHYKFSVVKDTDAMKLGRAVHLAILEPGRFKTDVAVWTGDRRAGKVWDAFKADNDGKELLTEEEHKQAVNVAVAVRANETARKYLAAGTSETTILWEAGGHSCKGRIDFDGELALVEIKKAKDASTDGFGKQAAQLGYPTQTAFYADGYAAVTGKQKPFVIIAAEPEPPFAVQVYRVTEAQLAKGRAQYAEWLDRLAYCRKHDFWPSYFDGEADLVLPPWAQVA